MDYRIFSVHTDVNACGYTRECTETVRESALKVDSGKKKSHAAPGNRTCVSGVSVRRSTNCATSPPGERVETKDKNKKQIKDCAEVKMPDKIYTNGLSSAKLSGTMVVRNNLKV